MKQKNKETAPLSLALDIVMQKYDSCLSPEIASDRLQKLLKDLVFHLKKIVGWDEFIEREIKASGLDV